MGPKPKEEQKTAHNEMWAEIGDEDMEYLLSALIAWAVTTLVAKRRFDTIDRYMEEMIEKLKEIFTADKPE